MFWLIVSLVASQPSARSTDGLEYIKPRTAVERATRCKAGTVTLRPEPDEPGSEMLVISNEASITDGQLKCIDVAAGYYDVRLSNEVQPRFDAIRNERFGTEMAAKGRQWLADHNLLSRLPVYDPKLTDDAVFACQIEELCGATGALHSKYGFHALSPDCAMRGLDDTKADNAPLTCLLNVTWATGYELGFIGNEAFGR